MARKVDNFPNLTKYDYPWEEWADGNVWVLTPGEDFQCSIESMRATCFNFANKRMLKLRTRVVHGELVIQFAPAHVPAVAGSVANGAPSAW